jgi:hypothetical protein
MRNHWLQDRNGAHVLLNTYIPLHRGFVYLFAVLDWASRRV